MSQPPRLLFKFPSRSRPERFFRSLDSIYDNLHDLENFQVQITADVDDKTMTDRAVFDRIKQYPNANVLYGLSKSKVDAVNRDISLFKDWDIICCHSDDMIWTMYGFDSIIRQQFEDGDFDKLIHIEDTDARRVLPTYYIAGKTYFDRFGYIYNPEFKSLWCDNLAYDIAVALGKYRFVENSYGMLFHEHPSYGHIEFDDQYKEQQGFWNSDEAKYYEIKNRGYDLHLFQK